MKRDAFRPMPDVVHVGDDVDIDALLERARGERRPVAIRRDGADVGVVQSMDAFLEAQERTAYMLNVVERLLESESEEGIAHDEVVRRLGRA